MKRAANVRELPTTGLRRRIMRSNTRKGTSPELRLRRELFRRNLRFRVDYPVKPRLERPIRIDVAFPGHELAVFVDGCFWHSCPIHKTTPQSNQEYWAPKLRGNRERDITQTDALDAAGWTVIRIWEHSVQDSVDIVAVGDCIEGVLRS